MEFFTDITTNASNYCLLKIDKYNDKRKYKKIKIFVDPGVYELKNNKEFSQIHKLHKLVEKLAYYQKEGIQTNEYISIDYPNDMNEQFSDLFIKKSYQNNIRYKDINHYICTIQYNFMDIDSFITEFLKLEPIWKNNPNKIIGIGNLCRIMYPNDFSDMVFQILEREFKGRKIHIYGLALRLIRRYIPDLLKSGVFVSIDSTKFTRAVTNELKKRYGINCKKATRDIFFNEYVNEIKKEDLEVIY